METIMFSPFLLLGTTNQRQWININYFTDFIDDPSAPANQIVVELQSRHIQVYTWMCRFGMVSISVQVYSARLQVQAELSGLRHIMYHHPWISSVSGIIANITVLTTIILISYTRYVSNQLFGDYIIFLRQDFWHQTKALVTKTLSMEESKRLKRKRRKRLK